MSDPDDTNTNPISDMIASAKSDAGATPIIPDDAGDIDSVSPRDDIDYSGIIGDIVSKIDDAHNILVALSSNPSVDELAAAIGFSLSLDRLNKRTTAIYSGATPNALKFLKPEETFESKPEILQDFVIALNKDKADHLRYKIDGDYVKIFITPYRSRITQEDLEFSYGDFNVDLVIALDVANGIDLDDALREHGRIMHDAVVINITTGKPGKLGEIEWSNRKASSVSEMAAELLYSMGNLEKEEATAFLTGIVAATDRFANAHTTARSLEMASRLVDSGANQQLVAKNITADTENERFSQVHPSEEINGPFNDTEDEKPIKEEDATKLDIQHGNEKDIDESKEVDTPVVERESTLLDDLKAAEASLAGAGAEVTPDNSRQPIRFDSTPSPSAPVNQEIATPPPVETANQEINVTSPVEVAEQETVDKPEKVITPPTDFATESLSEGTNKYGQMLEDALAETRKEADEEPTAPQLNSMPDLNNPAASIAPPVASAPEINGVPEINYMPMPGDEILPPPPAPPVDFNITAPLNTPNSNPAPLGAQPAMQDQVYAPQVANPGAFQIPSA